MNENKCNAEYDGSTCTLDLTEVDGEMTHYGPSHMDESTNTGWLDESLPQLPAPFRQEEPVPGEL